MMRLVPIFIPLATVGVLILATDQIQAKKSSNTPRYCQQDECLMSAEHYSLYSFVKRALDSNWDITGKEIYPLLQAVDVLERRYENELGSMATLNGTELVHGLLSNEELARALKIFKSDEGSALVDLYRAPISGRSQSLACSGLRVRALEQASRKLDSNLQLDGIFHKIHKNYMRKSAKRCLKYSCNSVENSMSYIQSALGKYQPSEDELASLSRHRNLAGYNISDSANTTTGSKAPEREFEAQELEICRFLKMTNASDCTISANEMKQFNLTFDGRDNLKSSDYYKLVKYYSENKIGTSKSDGDAIDGRHITKHCVPLRSLLDYHLSGLKFYQAQGLIDKQKLSNRTFWCPSLAYWLQVERICDELEASAWKSVVISMTLSYELDKPQESDNKQNNSIVNNIESLRLPLIKSSLN